jgi:general secretion pathway protein C
MVSRLFAFLVWAACAAGVTYWGLRWLAKPLPVPAHSASVAMTSAPRGDLARLLTAPESAASDTATPSTDQSVLAARIQLIGLMAAAGGGGPGVALLTVDGKPAKAFRVGQAVDGAHVVLAITRQGVDIGLPNTPASVTLPAQSLPPPATGTLASSTTTADPASMAPPPSNSSSPSRTADDANMSNAFGQPNSQSNNGGREGRMSEGTKFRVSPL